MLACLGLLNLAAACDRREPAPELRPSPTATERSPPASIIRPEIAAEADTPSLLTPLEARLSFAEGEAELSEAAIDELAAVLRSPQIEAGGPITLRGHSDSGGGGEANMRAARARAEAVRDWLIENGVDEERITVIAFGEQNPIEPNALPDGSPNEAGRAANRRVDIHIGIPDETRGGADAEPEANGTGEAPQTAPTPD